MAFINVFRNIFIASFLSIVAVLPVNAQESDCASVAQIFGKIVCRAEITVEEKHIGAIKAQFEEQGIASEEALKSKSLERLKDIIWIEALEHKFGEAALKPTEEEITLYSKAFKGSLEKSHKENKKNAAKIKEALAGDQYGADNELRLRNLLASIETSIVFYEEREKYNKDMPPEFHTMVAEAQRGIAESMVRDWKINQALYQEYGGRIVFQQGGLEPVDAYGAFMGYIRGEGALVITDAAYSDVFKEMDLYISAPHNALPESEAEIYQNYFSTPQWQFEQKITAP